MADDVLMYSDRIILKDVEDILVETIYGLYGRMPYRIQISGKKCRMRVYFVPLGDNMLTTPDDDFYIKTKEPKYLSAADARKFQKQQAFDILAGKIQGYRANSESRAFQV